MFSPWNKTSHVNPIHFGPCESTTGLVVCWTSADDVKPSCTMSRLITHREQQQRLSPSHEWRMSQEARQARHPEGQVRALFCSVGAEHTQKLNLNIKSLKPNRSRNGRGFWDLPSLIQYHSAAVAQLVTQEDPFVGVAWEPWRRKYCICNIRPDFLDLPPQKSTAVEWWHLMVATQSKTQCGYSSGANKLKELCHSSWIWSKCQDIIYDLHLQLCGILMQCLLFSLRYLNVTYY